MRRPLSCLVLAASLAIGSSLASAGGLPIVVKAGRHDRQLTPIRLSVPESTFGAEALRALNSGPIALAMRPEESPDSTPITVQAERAAGEPRRIRLTWVSPGKLPAGSERRYSLDTTPDVSARSAWAFSRTKAGALELSRGDRPVFRYNATPVLAAGLPEIQRRDSYLHPFYTPSGVLATGDFSKFHTHHRGFFLAYAKARAGDEPVDVWNIHSNNGRIVHDGLSEIKAGAVSAGFAAKHRWETKAGKPFLEERWDLEIYDVPGTPYWLFDLTSTQAATDRPVELPRHRYGGMAYRGPEPFVKGKLDVRTSDGQGRADRDQKPARWVDLTGPVADGSSQYAGAMIADHPSNVNHPTVARIHPTTLPFFSYVPAHDNPVTLQPGKPQVFRYRILVHDGHPDAALDERIWRDFAEPPVASLAAPR